MTRKTRLILKQTRIKICTFDINAITTSRSNMPDYKRFGQKQITAGHRPTFGHKHIASAHRPTFGHKHIASSYTAGITGTPPNQNPQVPFAGVPTSKVLRRRSPLAGVPPGTGRVDKRIPLGMYARNAYKMQARFRDLHPASLKTNPNAFLTRFVTQNTYVGRPLWPVGNVYL